MKRVRTSDLRPGMKTAEDVYSYNNQKIIPKDTVLDDKMITRLEFYSVLSIRVSDEVATEEASPFEIPEDSSYAQKVRHSKEFKEFEKSFISATESFTHSIRRIVDEDIDIEPDTLMSIVTDLLDSCKTTGNILDMLHNMRQYDDYTYMHSLNVAIISNVLAQWLHLGSEDRSIITVGAMLHDIGKLKVPEKIINKPGKLTPQEYNIIKTHTLQGYNILKDKNIDGRIKECALMHHERCDGSGYPLGLVGDNISPYAKIVAIADVYDAMTSARIYRGPICPMHVVGVFESEGLQKYDSKFLLTFLEHISYAYMNNRVRLSNGQEGEIVFMNPHQYSKPMVQTADAFIDLSVEKDIYIETFV